MCNHDSLSHFDRTLPCEDLKVSKLFGNEDLVYSYVSPSSKLYAWDSRNKKIINKLDCSKLIPCSESLKSIAIEEHLSPTAISRQLGIGRTSVYRALAKDSEIK